MGTLYIETRIPLDAPADTAPEDLIVRARATLNAYAEILGRLQSREAQAGREALLAAPIDIVTAAGDYVLTPSLPLRAHEARQAATLADIRGMIAAHLTPLRDALRGLLDATGGADFTDQRGERAFNAAVEIAEKTLGDM
jgi:hypothetical protein